MRYLFIFAFVASFFPGCDSLNQETNVNPVIPSGTPFIVGILEATEDTVHYYPEIYVGYVRHPEGFQVSYGWKLPYIWWPITNIQVTRPATRLGFKHDPDTEAQVVVTGPLNEPKEAKVKFTHVGKGVYGDVRYKLPLIGGEKYRLKVTMNDGRSYTALTRIPELFEWKVPERAIMELKLKKDFTGKYFEIQKEYVSLPFSVSPRTEYIAYQTNSEYQYEHLNAEKGALLFDNRSKYLRFGPYGIFDASDQPQIRAINLGWTEYYDHPIHMTNHFWLRLYQLNKPLSRFYFPVLKRLATSDGGRFDRQDSARVWAERQKNSNYFLEYMSNIKKIKENGEVINTNEAFGVFGAYTAAYRQITVIPKRSWNPDTVGTKRK